MTTLVTPEAKDWNKYWVKDETKKFTQISWSKKRIIEKVLPYCRKNGCALDAGCGSGFFAKFFIDQGMTTTALDYSQEALEIARKKTLGQAEIIQEDLLRREISSRIIKRYDLIFTDGLLEHFSRENQNVILQNLSSLLRSNGVLVTFVPNRFSPWELIRPFYMPGIDEKPFTLVQLRLLHKENNFLIVDQGGINTLPFTFSPDPLLGSMFGMLLYVIAKKI